MSFKRIMVLVLTLLMIVSACAPAIHAVAEGVHEHAETETKTEINYVSLGDYIASGTELKMNDLKDFDGFLELAPESYAAKFAAWLAGKEDTAEYKWNLSKNAYVYSNGNKVVNLMQLAADSARVEDIVYLISHSANYFAELKGEELEAEIANNPWLYNEVIANISSSIFPQPNDVAAFISSRYNTAIENADIISLAAGNVNFNEYLIEVIKASLAGDSSYNYMTFEGALELCVGDNLVTSVVESLYNTGYKVLEGWGIPAKQLDMLCGRIAYVSASYLVSYKELLDIIVELNPDVEIILLPLVNTLEDVALDVVYEGKTYTVDFGYALDCIHAPINAYIAALPTVQLGMREYDDAKFYYASLNEDVETFAKTFEGLYPAIENPYAYPVQRREMHELLINEICGLFDRLGLYYVPFTVAEVEFYEVIRAQGIGMFEMYANNTDEEKLHSIGMYLGVVEAIVNSLNADATIDVSDADLNALLGQDVLFGAFDSEFEKVYEEYITAKLIPQYGADVDEVKALLEDPNATPEVKVVAVNAKITALKWATPNAVVSSVANDATLTAIFYLYGRFIFADRCAMLVNANGHETIFDAMKNAYENKYTVQDETIKNVQVTAEFIANIVAEYYDDAYLYGYNYLDENGYIEVAVQGVDKAIEAIELAIREVEGGLLGVTDELKAELVKELYATIDTLKEIREVLASGSASDVDGFVKALLALEDDLYRHLSNLYAICEQAGADIYEVLKPYIDEAYHYITTEVLPKIDAAIKEFTEVVIDFYKQYVLPAYEKVLEIYGITVEVYERIVETIIMINLYVENAIDKAVEMYNNVVEILIKVYGQVEKAVNTALEIYEYTLNFIEVHKEAIATGIEVAEKLYNGIVKIIERVYGNVEAAKFVAGKVFAIAAKVLDVLGIHSITDVIEIIDQLVDDVQLAIRVAKGIYNYILENREEIENGILTAKQIYEDIVALVGEIVDNVKLAIEVAEAVYPYVRDAAVAIGRVVEFFATTDLFENIYNEIIDLLLDTYLTTKDIYNTVNKIYDYIIFKILEIKGITEDALHNAVNGSYELKDDSLYVALGEEAFGELLAEKLNLGEKFFRFGVAGDYLDQVAKADLVTVKVDNDGYIDFAKAQAMGTVAEIVTSNEDLMRLYDHPFVGEYVKNAVGETGIDLEATVIELEWEKYVDSNEMAKINDLLAKLKAELLRRDIPEYYYIDLQPVVDKAFEENGLAGLPGIAIEIDPIVVPVADLVVFAVENVLYGYAEFVYNVDTVIENVHSVSPDATIVFVGVTSPLEHIGEFDFAELGIDFVDYDDCVMAADTVVDVLNARLYTAALTNENTIFVEENDADAIYDALNVYCDHVYDDCVDADCNRCLAVRVVPGHSFTNYVFNNDATCEDDGTETAKCDNCDAQDTRTAIRTAIGHDWKDATCTSVKTCKTCGATQGTTKAHSWENATCTEPKTCKVCHRTEGKPAGHKYGAWITTVEATRKSEGERKQVCRVCGHTVIEVLPIIPPKHSVETIVTVILAAIATSVGISAIVFWSLRRKDILN